MLLSFINESVKRSIRNRERARFLGTNIKGHKLWTAQEDGVLRSNYPDLKAIYVLLPHRNRNAIWHRCQRLGLKQSRHQWRASEISKLRRIYPYAPQAIVLSEFPGISWDAIRMAAKYHGVQRRTKRPPYKRTGKQVIDAILSRLEDIGWSLGDLDDAARTGRYFRSHSWRRFKLKFDHIHRAVRALDGELLPAWKQYD